MCHAIVDGKTMEVINLIIWEGAEWLPPRGCYVIRSDEAKLGDKYDPKTNTFISPPEKENV